MNRFSMLLYRFANLYKNIVKEGKGLINIEEFIKFVDIYIEGWYNKQNKAFDFTYKGQDAMLWVGQNCELVNE